MGRPNAFCSRLYILVHFYLTEISRLLYLNCVGIVLMLILLLSFTPSSVRHMTAVFLHVRDITLGLLEGRLVRPRCVTDRQYQRGV